MMPSSIEERLIQVEVRVEEQGGRLIELSQQVRALDQKVERRLEALDQKFDRRFDALTENINEKIDGKIDGLRAEMAKQFRWTVGLMITLAGIIVALVRP